MPKRVALRKHKKLSDPEPGAGVEESKSGEVTEHPTTEEFVDVEADSLGDEVGDVAEKRKRKRKRKTEAAASTASQHPSDSAAGGGIPLHSGPVSNFVNAETVYVEGLPFTATDEEVIKFFSECGPVKSVRLPRWHDSNRLRGYGHVEFHNSSDAAKAFELDGCDFLDSGRYVKVERPQAPRALQQKTGADVLRPAGCRTVFVKNLPYEITEDDIIEVFRVCGPVSNVRLAVWGHTNQLKGFGYVEFKREDSAEIAVKKSGVLSMKGRPLIVDFETGVPKGSFRQSTAAPKTGKK